MYPSLTRFPGDLFADFDGLQRQLEQLFGPRSLPSSIRAAGRGAFPAVNMGVTESAVEIYAFAPGLDASQIDVQVDKGLLTISGERKDGLPEASDSVSVFAAERFSGAFRRVVSLPDDLDTAQVDATYRNGVLKLVIPKRAASMPKRIQVGE